jgi:ribosomal protein L17
MRYRFNGKENILSFGPYPATTLARARELRTEAKALLVEGIDPSAHAKEKKAMQAALTETHVREKLLPS